MKKPTKRLGSLKRKTRAGKPSTRNATQLSSLQKAQAAQKAIKAKLKTLKAEFKQKLQAVSQTAYEQAMRDFQRDHVKRIEAKQKIIAAAEAKFEKKFAKKTKSSHRRKGATLNATALHHTATTGKHQGRRGRPRKTA